MARMHQENAASTAGIDCGRGRINSPTRVSFSGGMISALKPKKAAVNSGFLCRKINGGVGKRWDEVN